MEGIIIHVDRFIDIKKTEKISLELEYYLPRLFQRIVEEKLEFIILTELEGEKRELLYKIFSSYAAYIQGLKEVSLQALISKYLLITDSSRFAKSHHFKGGVICYYQYPGNDELAGCLQGVILQGMEEVDISYLKEVYQMYKGNEKVMMQSERLTIRESKICDEKIFTQWQGDDEEAITDLEEYQKQHYRYYGFGLWTVVRSSDGEVVGRAGIEYRILADKPVLELGYIIGPAYREQGYAYEACLRILKYVWEEMEKSEVAARVRKDNMPSRFLLSKLGFQYERQIGEQIQIFMIKRGERK